MINKQNRKFGDVYDTGDTELIILAMPNYTWESILTHTTFFSLHYLLY